MVVMKRLSSYASFMRRFVRLCVDLIFHFLSSDVSAGKGGGRMFLIKCLICVWTILYYTIVKSEYKLLSPSPS